MKIQCSPLQHVLLGGLLAVAATCALTPAARAQCLANVECLGTPLATQVSNGLGFNIDQDQDWEFAMSNQAGGTEARFQCHWDKIQTQNSDNTPGPFNLAGDNCDVGVASAIKHHQRPLLLAAYGPPFQDYLDVKVTTAVLEKDGTKSIQVQVVNPPGGTLNNVEYPNFHVLEPGTPKVQITAGGTNGYYGALITVVTPTNGGSSGTIKLAAPVNIDLPVGQMLTINQLLYPSVAGTSETGDSSNIAYAGNTGMPTTSASYTGYLANELSALLGTSKLTGRVEIWNEPPWKADPWEQRYRFYSPLTSAPDDLDQTEINYGFAQIIEPEFPPSNVRFIWGGTEKDGGTRC